jgi:sugar phosphate isomerase/epimerase
LIKDFAPQDLGLAYDIRHAQVEGGLSWPTHFNLVKSHIAAVCVKDFAWEGGKVKTVALGQGQVDAKVLQMVKASNFSGPISLHVEYGEASQDRKFFADAFRQDFATLRGWLGA